LSTVSQRKLGDFITLNDKAVISRKAAQYCDFLGELQYLVDSDSSLTYCTLIINAKMCTALSEIDSDGQRYLASSYIAKLKSAFGVTDAQFAAYYHYIDSTTNLRVMKSYSDEPIEIKVTKTSDLVCQLQGLVNNSRVLINVDSSTKTITWIKVLVNVSNP